MYRDVGPRWPDDRADPPTAHAPDLVRLSASTMFVSHPNSAPPAPEPAPATSAGATQMQLSTLRTAPLQSTPDPTQQTKAIASIPAPPPPPPPPLPPLSLEGTQQDRTTEMTEAEMEMEALRKGAAEAAALGPAQMQAHVEAQAKALAEVQANALAEAQARSKEHALAQAQMQVQVAMQSQELAQSKALAESQLQAQTRTPRQGQKHPRQRASPLPPASTPSAASRENGNENVTGKGADDDGDVVPMEEGENISTGPSERALYTCPHPGCTKQFDRKYQLSVHSRLRTFL
jgi:hypothetical protein